MIDRLMVRRIQTQINSMHLQRNAFTLTFLVLPSKVEETTFLEMNHLIFDTKVSVKNRICTFTCHHTIMHLNIEKHIEEMKQNDNFNILDVYFACSVFCTEYVFTKFILQKKINFDINWKILDIKPNILFALIPIEIGIFPGKHIVPE